ncbi:MAG: 50S ribosomal protein L18 [Dehalococcoidia bacterium]|nr:50S ribosomal protein L18 [Dehalococcoidia bacterium]MDW8119295.1 50S ribosomal protein L18 [Chloroflexota bacterium]
MVRITTRTKWPIPIKWNTPRLRRIRRHLRIRKKVQGTPARPRLAVFRSNKHIYAQIIDDTRGHTLVSASDMDREVRSQGAGKRKTERAALVGRLLAQRATAAGIQKVVFDRGGFRYQGRVKALADAAREGGLQF